MTKLKGPLSSLKASGTISRCITFLRRHKQDIAEEKPEIKDVQSTAQLSWRHMFLKCTALWHALSTLEQAQWESLARAQHMTGYAYWQSQCLRPNPGIYLPLQGGTMSGDIDMAKNRLLKLPAPADPQEAFRLSDYATYVLPYLLREGARVYHNVNQAIPHAAGTTVAFNSERYDTDTIHDLVINNSRLTCQTAGKYAIMANTAWALNAAGLRWMRIILNLVTTIAMEKNDPDIAQECVHVIATIYNLAIGDFVELKVYQNSGAPLNLMSFAQHSPEFMMQRIGV